MSEATTRIERLTAHPEAAVPTPVDVLRLSRVGLIASHLWVYLLPLIHGGFEVSRNFWIGLAYVTVPLGLLIYGWNDYFDWDIDHISRRKNNRKMAAVFGPSLSRRQLGWVPLYVVLAQLPFGILWAVTGHLPLVGWLCLMALGNALYNGPGLRLSRVPILAELTATGIYLLILWLGLLIHSPAIPWWSWAFAASSILVFQVAGTMADREEDAKVGKRTLSVAFGRSTAFVVLLVLVSIKIALTYGFTRNLGATAAMIVGLILLATGHRFPRCRASSSAYASFIILDWLWLALVVVG